MSEIFYLLKSISNLVSSLIILLVIKDNSYTVTTVY